MWRTIRWVLVLGALTVWGMTDFVSTLATCQHNQQEKGEQGAEKACGFTQSLTYNAIAASSKWIDDKHDFVTAVATLVVAIFTFTLWRATDRLWQAGERQLELTRALGRRQLDAMSDSNCHARIGDGRAGCR
jgi:hypothetical protein